MDYSKIINIHTGEISQKIEGVDWDLKVTFRTIVDIESALGLSTPVILSKSVMAQLTLEESATILLKGVMTKTPNIGIDLDKIMELMFKNGYRHKGYQDIINAILWFGLTGGKDPKKAQETVESGQTLSPGSDT